MSRVSPKVVRSFSSPNKSSRNGALPRLIVVHSTESPNRAGTSDLVGVGQYLCRPEVQASSHVIVDADPGVSVRLVPDSMKAWTQGWWNPWCLSVEQIGRAAQKEWARDELRETARWIARWCDIYDIRPYKGEVSNASGRVVKSGVLRHSELGQRGGGHHDPGDSYPLDKVLALSRFYLAKRRS